MAESTEAMGTDTRPPAVIVDDVHVEYKVLATGKRAKGSETSRKLLQRGRKTRRVHALKGVSFVAHEGIAKDRFEFQMLYGVRRDLQASLVAEGYGVRVYIPFGGQWFPYFMRRLGERPANVSFVLRSLLREN